MKELKQDSIIQTHYLPRYKPKKRWTIAQRRPDKLQVMQNECVEAAYHRVMALAKSRMQQGEVYYERDLKTDFTQGLLSMHSFVSPTFSWSLYCQFTYDYFIDYAIGDCPYKAEILLALKAFPLDRVAHEKQLKADYSTYYKTVLTVQEPQHIHTL